MKRGEIWTIAGGGDFLNKPRPVVIVQDDQFELNSVTVCPVTTNPREAELFRVEVNPSAENGLQIASRVMADKLATVRRTRLGRQIGNLGSADMAALSMALYTFLGLANEIRSSRDRALN